MSAAPYSLEGYEVVIGFETHARLNLTTKLFSRAPFAFGAAPNTLTSAVDLALPGALPVMNRGAVDCAIRLGLALGSDIARQSVFARKSYFYPDLPKGYQISQYEAPILRGGTLAFLHDGSERRLSIERAHLEEDAGKSLHEDFAGMSGIDLNRAGTALLEIVTAPDLRSPDEAADYARTLHALLMWLEICDGNLQEGSFRCDANVSVRRPGAPLGVRREIKNLNSFRFLRDAIECEARWQIEELQSGRAIRQTTVLYDPQQRCTQPMRDKEDAQDYRYFPDPDLPPLVLSDAWVEQVRAQMPELPQAAAARLLRSAEASGLSAADVAWLTQSRAHLQYFERCIALGVAPKAAANWMQGALAKKLNDEEREMTACPLDAAALAALLRHLAVGDLPQAGARKLFEALWQQPQSDVDTLIAQMGLGQSQDAAQWQAWAQQVLQDPANAASIAEYRAGKEKALNALVGRVMKLSAGRANAAEISEFLRATLRT